METRLLERRKRVDQPLKPSLVEWKLGHEVRLLRHDGDLETFLVEWKLGGRGVRSGAAGALKPSLVGWKQARKEGWA